MACSLLAESVSRTRAMHEHDPVTLTIVTASFVVPAAAEEMEHLCAQCTLAVMSNFTLALQRGNYLNSQTV